MREKPVVIGLDYSLKRPLADCLRFFFSSLVFFFIFVCVGISIFKGERRDRTLRESQGEASGSLGHRMRKAQTWRR